MKIFVTGAEGFIGSHVVEDLLARGHDVTALVQYNSFNSVGWLEDLVRSRLANLRVVLGDIRDTGFVHEAIVGHERVIHLAALIAIPYSYAAPASYLETNGFGTLNVLEASRANGIERVVHTSTSEVYGSAQYVPIDEAHPVVAQSPYAASKVAGDQLASSYWASFSLPVVTLRPFNAYGPRQSQRAFIPSAIVQLIAGHPEIRLGSLSPTRDFTFVSDTARGFSDAVESDKGVGETFNMGSAFEVAMNKVVEILFNISGQEPAILQDIQRVRPAASEVERLWSNSSKMRETFGWQPEFEGIDGLRRGLELTFDWLKHRKNLPGYDSLTYIV